MSKHIFVLNTPYSIDEDEAAFGDLKFVNDTNPPCSDCSKPLHENASINNLKKAVICDCGTEYKIHSGSSADNKKEPIVATTEDKKVAKKAPVKSTPAKAEKPVTKPTKAEKPAKAVKATKPAADFEDDAPKGRKTVTKAEKPATKKASAPREGGIMTKKLKLNPEHEFNPRKGSIPALVSSYFKKATIPTSVMDEMVGAFKKQTDVMSATAAKNPKAYMTWYILHMVRTGVLISA